MWGFSWDIFKGKTADTPVTNSGNEKKQNELQQGEGSQELKELQSLKSTGIYFKPQYEAMENMMHSNAYRLEKFLLRMTKGKQKGEWATLGAIQVGISETTQYPAINNDKYHIELQKQDGFDQFCCFEKVAGTDYFREITTHAGCEKIINEFFDTLSNSHPDDFQYRITVIGFKPD